MGGWGTGSCLGQGVAHLTASFLRAQIGSCEKVYLGIFTFELLTKVLAYGFLWHPEAYLRDAWCQLDFVVVTLAWAPVLFPAMGNYSVIRSFRALRPLRALKRMPGMPKLAAAACWKRRPAPSLASAQPGLRPAWPPWPLWSWRRALVSGSGRHGALGRSTWAARGAPARGKAAVRQSARPKTADVLARPLARR